MPNISSLFLEQLPKRGLAANSAQERTSSKLCQPMHSSNVPMDENYNNQV